MKSNSVYSQSIDFCGVFPDHQATGTNQDSIFWDRFGNSYDISYEEPDENMGNRNREICGYFEIDYFNFGAFPEQRSIICSVFESLSDSIQQRINISICGDTMLPSMVKIRVSRANNGQGVLGSASAVFYKVGEQSSCTELFEDMISKKINGSFSYPPTKPTLIPYDGRIVITNDTSINWYLGDGAAPNGTYDLYSIVLHEAGHLLGFGSFIDSTGFEEGFISTWDQMIHVTPEYLALGQSGNLKPLLISDCAVNCWALNDTLYNNFEEVRVDLINNCNQEGDWDFVLGNNALAPIFGGELNNNNLSHLNPNCNNESINYVMQRSISDSIPNNQRREFSPSEKEIFCRLGYKWGQCDVCYFTANSEQIEFVENMNYDPVFYGCVNDTVTINFLDISCNEYSNEDFPEITFWDSPSGVSVIKNDSSFSVIGFAQGTFPIYYGVSACDCRVLKALFYVSFGPCFDCATVDPCDNLTCVNGFEQFPTDLGSYLINEELSDGPYWVYENTVKNTVDICQDTELNKYVNIGGFDTNLEGICLKLSEPVAPGCNMIIKMDAASGALKSALRIHVSKDPPCNFVNSRISIECMPTECDGYQFRPICVDTIALNNLQHSNEYCSSAPNLLPIVPYKWHNNSEDTIWYVILSPIINQSAIRLDNIVIQKTCLDPAFSFEYLENCNEVSFISFQQDSVNTHLWYFDDDSTSTDINPIHLFTDSDTFLVTHILKDFCGQSDTSKLNVIINDHATKCCPDTTISSSTTWDLNTTLPGDGRFHTITIQQGVSLVIDDGLTLEFCEGGSLIIENGAFLDLEGTLTTFGDMTWLGVYVQGDSSLSQENNVSGGGYHGLQQGMIYCRAGSIIENAKVGLRNYGPQGMGSTGGMIKCEGTTFINNSLAIDFGPYQNNKSNGQPIPSLGSFRDCSFHAHSAYYLHEPFFGFIRLRKVDGMRFAGCDFINELLPELPSQVADFGFGIHSVSSGFEVYATGSTASTPLCAFPCVVYDSTTFNGLGHGVYVMTQDKMRPYSVYQSHFENCFRGITSVGTTGGAILFNTFKLGHVPDYDYSYGQIGAEFHFPHEGFTLQENLFVVPDEETESLPIGVLCNGLGEFDNEIRRNTFIGIETANQAFGENADTSTIFPGGLRYFCNSFENTPSYGHDFHIPNTPGLDLIHRFQTPGSSQGSNVSTGNHFAYTAQDFTNLGEGGISYWYYPPGDNEEPRDSFSANILKAQGLVNQCATDYCAPPCIEVIADIKEDYFNHLDDYEENLDLYINVIASANQARIDSARSKTLYYRRLSSRDAYTIVQHLMIDTLDYHVDSLITWMGHLDTYGAEVMIAGEYAAAGDFESALDVLETITARRDISPAQSVDLGYLIDIYSLQEVTPVHSFTPQDRSFLRNIAYSNSSAASGVSRALLSSFGEYVPLPYNHGEQINFRNAFPESTDTSFFITEKFPLTIYPNPSNSDITIEWKYPEKTFEFLVVYDLFGQKVLELNGEYKSPFKLNTNNWKDGVHWIIAQDNEGFSHFGKVLIFRN